MENPSSTEGLFFDVNAKLEEQQKSGDTVKLGFNLDISTKPNVVKYTLSGTVTLEGSQADIKKKLELNPKTQIPQILFTVYQHVFNSIFIVSSILGTPYPPPDLLHPMAEKIQIVSENKETRILQSDNSPVQPRTEQTATSSNTSASSSAAK